MQRLERGWFWVLWIGVVAGQVREGVRDWCAFKFNFQNVTETARNMVLVNATCLQDECDVEENLSLALDENGVESYAYLDPETKQDGMFVLFFNTSMENAEIEVVLDSIRDDLSNMTEFTTRFMSDCPENVSCSCFRSSSKLPIAECENETCILASPCSSVFPFTAKFCHIWHIPHWCRVTDLTALPLFVELLAILLIATALVICFYRRLCSTRHFMRSVKLYSNDEPAESKRHSTLREKVFGPSVAQAHNDNSPVPMTRYSRIRSSMNKFVVRGYTVFTSKPVTEITPPTPTESIKLQHALSSDSEYNELITPVQTPAHKRLARRPQSYLRAEPVDDYVSFTPAALRPRKKPATSRPRSCFADIWKQPAHERMRMNVVKRKQMFSDQDMEEYNEFLNRAIDTQIMVGERNRFLDPSFGGIVVEETGGDVEGDTRV